MNELSSARHFAMRNLQHRSWVSLTRKVEEKIWQWFYSSFLSVLGNRIFIILLEFYFRADESNVSIFLGWELHCSVNPERVTSEIITAVSSSRNYCHDSDFICVLKLCMCICVCVYTFRRDRRSQQSV